MASFSCERGLKKNKKIRGEVRQRQTCCLSLGQEFSAVLNVSKVRL